MSDLDKQKAKKKIRKELMNADWDLQSYESDVDIEVMVYLYDHFDTKELMMAGLRSNDLEELAGYKHPMEAITGSIEGAFQNYASSSNHKVRAQRTEILGSALGLYMLNTKTYSKLMKIAIEPGEYRHFIVLRYKNRNTVESTFRPFSLVSKFRTLSPEEIHNISLSVIEHDESKNADYFHFNPVSDLRK